MNQSKQHVIKNENWIDLVGEDDDTLVAYTKKYQLPTDYLSGVNDRFEIARTEESNDADDVQRMLVLLQYITDGESIDDYVEYTTHAISLVHVENHVITAYKKSTSYFEDVFDSLRDNDIDYEKIVLNVFYAIQKNTIEMLRSIHNEIGEMQNDIQQSSKSQELYRLIAIDKSLSAIDNAVHNNRKVLDKLVASAQFNRSGEAKDILHDVMVESLQAESMVNQAIRIVDLLNDVFGNVISNNLNQVMKVLTSITIILTIPTITAGLWGMNTTIPMEHNDQGFMIIIIISILISVLVAIWLRKKNYL